MTCNVTTIEGIAKNPTGIALEDIQPLLVNPTK